MSQINQTSKTVTPDRFAVYCGDGVYVHAVEHLAQKIKLKTGGEEGALNASRPVAVAALHVARRAGLGAWLVQHPAYAVGCNYSQQVAA